jgi:hypothetical protein
MTVHYSTILTQCLAHKDKIHREQVLLQHDPATVEIVRRVMQGIAKRLANYIVHAGARDYDLTAADRRKLRRERLAAIREPWLRERVSAMVKERYPKYRAAQHDNAVAAAREAIG